jgi:hypothetical protein
LGKATAKSRDLAERVAFKNEYSPLLMLAIVAARVRGAPFFVALQAILALKSSVFGAIHSVA